MFSGMYGIILIQDKEEELIAYFEENVPKLRALAYLFPTLIISVSNVFLPNFTKLMVWFEKYDYPESETKQEIWRNYIIKMISLLFFVMI